MTGESLYYYEAPADSAQAQFDDGLLVEAPPGRGRPQRLYTHGREELFFRDNISRAPSLMLGQLVDCRVVRVRYRECEDFMSEVLQNPPAPAEEPDPNTIYKPPPSQAHVFTMGGKQIKVFPEMVTAANIRAMQNKVVRASRNDGAKFVITNDTPVSLEGEPPSRLEQLASALIPGHSRVVTSLVKNWYCCICFNRFDSWDEVNKHVGGMGSSIPECPGTPTGVQVSLCDGLSGQIALRDISDSRLKTPLERVIPGMTLQARIRKIKIKYRSFELVSKSSHLRGDWTEFRETKEYSPQAWGWDEDFDIGAWMIDRAKAEKQELASKKKYERRAIDHPS